MHVLFLIKGTNHKVLKLHFRHIEKLLLHLIAITVTFSELEIFIRFSRQEFFC